MITDTLNALTRVTADGGTRPCPPDRLSTLKQEFKQLCSDAGLSANDRRELSGDIRFCRWQGQTSDGKKHDTDEKKAFPYEGASDARIRLTDGTVKFDREGGRVNVVAVAN